jgi:sulfur carrier protein
MSAPPLIIQLNGQQHIFEDLTSPTDLAQVIESLGLKIDRIAVEHNGEIASRTTWAQVSVTAGDRLEIVHFVGGGTT